MPDEHAALPSQVATLLANDISIFNMLSEVKMSLSELAKSHEVVRDFVSASSPRFNTLEEDRREMWAKINQVRDQELKEVNARVDLAHEAARTAKAASDIAIARATLSFRWFMGACAGYGGLLIAMFYAVLHISSNTR